MRGEKSSGSTMGWEIRGNNQYYYRKMRKGKKVISEYMGSGLLAKEIAFMDKRKKEQKEATRKKKAMITALDVEIEQALKYIKNMTDCILLISGCHKHKGMWRKRRNG